MKKALVSMLLVSALAVSMVGCGAKTEENVNNSTNTEQSTEEKVESKDESTVAGDVNVKELMDGILALEAVPMPMEIDEETATNDFHIDLNTVSEYAISVCGRSPGVGLVVLAEAKDGQVDAVKQSVEAILADKVAQAFYPEEKEVMESGKVEVNGNLVSLIIVNPEMQEEVNTYFTSKIAQ